MMTLLHVAIQKGNIDIIKFLLKIPHIDLKIKSTKIYKKVRSEDDFFGSTYFIVTENKTILNEAVACGYFKVVQYLLNNMNGIDINDSLVIDTIYVDHMSTAHNYYNEKINNPLFNFAVERENIGIINALLADSRININMKTISKIDKGGGCFSYSSSSESKTKKKIARFKADFEHRAN